MKRVLLIAFLLGISLHSFPQKQSSTDEVSTLKTQVTTLKQTNSKLDQNVKELKKIIKNLQDSLAAALKEYDVKLNAMQDSIKANTAIIHSVKNHSGLIDHSLKTRKKTFYAAFGLFIIIIIFSYLLVRNMFKTYRENFEIRISNTKDSIEMTTHKTKDDLQSQIATIKVEIAAAKSELEKKIKEVKK